MNVFFVDRDPRACAMALVDKHVGKMLIETCQLLSTAHWFNDTWTGDMCLPAYKNHPCARWVRHSPETYEWTFLHYVYLGEEFKYRYGHVHGSTRRIPALHQGIRGVAVGWQDPPLAMPKEYHDRDVVKAYRNYYSLGKAHLHRWTRRNPPEWIYGKEGK